MAGILFWRTKREADVICPHCGAHQSEPKDCISTSCKSCGGYFQPKKALKVQKHHKRPHSEKNKEINCFVCDSRLQVARMALSTICFNCGHHMDLNDYSVEGICSRNIETKGHLYVGQKGRLITESVAVGTAEIRGKVSTKNFLCEGIFELHPSATFFGHLEAQMLKILEGATFNVDRSMEVKNAEIYGKVKGKMICSGRVYIANTAQIDGDITARAVDSEPGAAINGYVNIRNVTEVDFKKESSPDQNNGGKDLVDSAMTA